MKYNEISELCALDAIEDAEDKYLLTYGALPFQLSTWNPSEFFRTNYLFNQTIFPESLDYINYIYPYDLEPTIIQPLAKKLCGSTMQPLVITNSGTLSISLITSVLVQAKCRKLLVINPTYFSVFYNCAEKGIAIREINIRPTNGKYILPFDAIIENLNWCDGIWLTAPIYNTGVEYNKDDLISLSKLIPSTKYIIADECFCKTGHSIYKYFRSNPRFMAIYDPMKQFLINGAKFSAITVSKEMLSTFYQWSDVVCGNLNTSTLQAIKIFLTAESDELLVQLEEVFNSIRKNVESISSNYPMIQIDHRSSGHMQMCYIPHLPANLLDNSDAIWNFQQVTGTSIIPGTRFHFASQDGFAFRINLARYEPYRFYSAIERSFDYFKNI